MICREIFWSGVMTGLTANTIKVAPPTILKVQTVEDIRYYEVERNSPSEPDSHKAVVENRNTDKSVCDDAVLLGEPARNVCDIVAAGGLRPTINLCQIIIVSG